MLHDISRLPLIGLRLFLAYCHPNLCTQPFLCPSFGQMFLNVMLIYSTASAPPVTPNSIVAQVTKLTKNFALGLMDGPYNSLEECPGQQKVLVRRKPRWQNGDVRNIDDCSENGINETFESNETYKPAGIDHHVSAIKLWEASLPGVKLHGFVADLWKHFRQIGINLNLVVVFWCHNSGSRRIWKATRLPFWGCSLCPRLCSPSKWQCVHFCNIVCSYLSR